MFLGCTCDPKGAEGDDLCAHNPGGDCQCKAGVTGHNCNRCADGYYGFGEDKRTGCKSMNYSSFDSNSSWKTTVSYLLYKVYDVIRLCKLKFSHSLAAGRKSENLNFYW